MTNQDLLALADTYGTPFYVFDLDALADRTRRIQTFFSGTASICYAMKANPFLVGPLKPQIERFEVCSQGEFHICERMGIPRKKIVLSGVSKTEEELMEVLEGGGAGIYTAESIRHLILLEQCGERKSAVLPVLLRVTSGNQFGMDRETVKDIVKRRKEYPFLHIIGLQYYSGTQKKKPEKVADEYRNFLRFAGELRDELGFEAKELEFGPGFPVPYFAGERWPEEEEWLNALKAAIEEEPAPVKVTLEMGRFLAAECGTYLTSVADQKRNEGENYLILDGGIHHVNYYGQMMAMKRPEMEFLPRKEGGSPETMWNLCGSLCTVSDVLVKEVPLPGPEIGDRIAFRKIGAYSVTEGIYLFLSRDLPKVLFFSEKEGPVLARDSLPTNVWNSPNEFNERKDRKQWKS
ncbi:alanine racemase [Cuneatibacter sp. NSJ-177]|uniref:alanine racemase n=1 Tax=Cuneatibacter sp. NSJ-177 TaxID=2931401 RepID=UPI001FCFF619|nr:alanine racemase [Cuneatibacter sp. NSJ-177]MCJ7835992.1 alanine racemase [Cuneatibacter sp. NSJ-177]